MTDTRITQRENTAPQKAPIQGTDTIHVPHVDIRENSERILLIANMPGVDRNDVSVTVENNTLTVEGRARIEGPAGHQLIGQEYEAGRYRRDFTLSHVVNTEGIKAKVHHGVLEVTIPKRDEAKTRKVEITN